MRKPRIKALGGNKVHKDWGGWRKFLASCEVRDTYRGVTYYGKTNCNYIVFPDGTLVANYGFHGKTMMAEVRLRGVKATLACCKEQHEHLIATLSGV